MATSLAAGDQHLEIIAFMLHEQQFCVRTISIREIRGWAPVTPLPHSPPEVMGVMNLRGSVIPIVDLAVKLGMPPAQTTERSAIVVTVVGGATIGLMVDRVSDILTISISDLQAVPVAAGVSDKGYAEGIFARGKDMICLLNLEGIFASSATEEWEKVA
ncbi:purine-binding chemotaxis protein CheW [Rhizobium sp. P38BS-XIX]|uniref:chemotaxis protein CheW n=1 Tax=Rhizobium sp. P38BS-XIX TaxID=2726740 RepID=UPI00145790A8|nr:chemotaxis protein CheW [Rhizobium sp. P38BS-XIX]NLR97457.1 purine-binding chemotaxis protein CheW [Rhizobium sp. P38BS-XIX]